MKKILNDKLYTNATYLMATTVMNSAIGFVFWYIVARFYEPDKAGLAITIISSVTLLAVLSTLGFNIGFIRFLPRMDEKKSQKMINSCFTLSGMLSIALAAVFILGLDFFSPKLIFIKKDVFMLLFVLFTCVWSLTILMDGLFVSRRIAKYVLARSAVFGIIKLLVPALVVALGAFGIFFSWGIAALAAFLLSTLCLLPRLGYTPGLSVDQKSIEHIIHFSFGNYVAGLLGYLPSLILPLMITNMLLPEVTAYFYIPWMISNLLFMIPYAVSTSLLAEVSTDEKGFRIKLRKAVEFTYLLVIPGVILLLILGDGLLLLVGREYLKASTALQIFALSGAFYAVNQIYVAVENIKKNVKAVITVNALTAFITLSLSYLLLGGMGLNGVAFAWLISQVFIAVAVSPRILKECMRGRV